MDGNCAINRLARLETRESASSSREIYQWSRDLVVFADLDTPIAPAEQQWLQETGTRVVHGSIERLHHENGVLRSVEMKDGTSIARSGLFCSVNLYQHSPLAEQMGCRITERGHIDVDREYRTSVEGVYAVGDAVTHLHQIAFAVASGARAAIAINTELTGKG